MMCNISGFGDTDKMKDVRGKKEDVGERKR